MNKLIFLIGIIAFQNARAGQWTEPVEVRYDTTRCVSYRARLAGQFVVIEAAHAAGWHTYAMDNQQRAEAKLAGRRSLGIDRPTEIKLSDGLETAGPWYQSRPKDFSRPELRWFAWGFEEHALFASKVRRVGAGPARITIRGQACSDTICRNIDVALSIPLTPAGGEAVNLQALVPVP